MRLVFCGTPDFSVPILERLKKQFPQDLMAVITRPDAPKGRGKKLSSSEVKIAALNHHLEVYEPRNKEDLSDIISQLKPDLLLVSAYGMILPKEVIDGTYCVNVHASLLPKYRGASPIQSAILNQESESGISLFKMSYKMDDGDILYKNKVSISPTDNTQVLHDNLSQLATEMCVQLVNDFKNKTLPPLQPQQHEEASYCTKIKKEDTVINPEDPVEKIFATIKAYAPNPGAILKPMNIKIIDAQMIEGELVPTLVKPEGKKLMDYKSYCLGNPPLPKLGAKRC